MKITEQIKIGEFVLYPSVTDEQRICIYKDDCEGGEFSIEKLEDAIRKFYNENF